MPRRGLTGRLDSPQCPLGKSRMTVATRAFRVDSARPRHQQWVQRVGAFLKA